MAAKRKATNMQAATFQKGIAILLNLAQRRRTCQREDSLFLEVHLSQGVALGVGNIQAVSLRGKTGFWGARGMHSKRQKRGCGGMKLATSRALKRAALTSWYLGTVGYALGAEKGSVLITAVHQPGCTTPNRLQEAAILVTHHNAIVVRIRDEEPTSTVADRLACGSKRGGGRGF